MKQYKKRIFGILLSFRDDAGPDAGVESDGFCRRSATICTV